MRALLALVLLAAAAPGFAGGYDDVDEQIARAGERLAKIEAPRLAGRYASGADCLERFDLDALTRDATSPAMLDDLGRQADFVVQHSFRYYTCKAAERGGDAACAGLAAYDDYARPHPRLECERYSKELVFIRALMTGGTDLPALCRADLTHPEDVEFQPKDFGAACAIMLSGYKDPKAACAKLTPLFVKSAQVEKCEAWLGSLSGDDRGCRRLGDNDVRERCFAYAAFSRARSSGDAKRCDGAGICEMFMGAEPGCAMYVRRIARFVCPSQDKRNARLAKERAALAAALDKAEADLKALPPGPGVGARLETVRLFRRRGEKK